MLNIMSVIYIYYSSFDKHKLAWLQAMCLNQGELILLDYFTVGSVSKFLASFRSVKKISNDWSQSKHKCAVHITIGLNAMNLLI